MITIEDIFMLFMILSVFIAIIFGNNDVYNGSIEENIRL